MIRDVNALPDLLEEVISSHGPIPLLYETDDQSQNARLHGNYVAVATNLEFGIVEFEVEKAIDQWAIDEVGCLVMDE
jgi:hypothetical protein